MTTVRGPSILPLPEDVVAQIKSSTAILSLTDVLTELVKNSLDAKATKIEATVDFARGGCTVEDNGLGISPLEFREDGGLGKLYCTSKYHARESLLGRNGTFLASLAAVSLLTIASRHHEYRSHNSLTFHHSNTVERQLPASAHQELHAKHGTRVTVRNLFGNLPVRVKQRSMGSGQRAEHDRLWDQLKRDITRLLLSWQGELSLRVRDSENRVLINFNTSSSSPSVGQDREAVTPRSTQLSSLLNILTQANYIAIDEWPSWVPASASTSAISINGAISLDPAPSKHVQFISLGVRPLSPDCGHNELFDQVNRLFALSSFGTVEDDAVVDEHEKIRRQSDKRFKQGGYTNRQLKARKDVDRYPMFHLRISMKDPHTSRASEDEFVGDEANLQNVTEVLGAMVTQWLSVHHFRPRQPRKRRERPSTACSLLDNSSETPAPTTTEHGSTKPITSSTSVASKKRKRLKDPISNKSSEKEHRQAFADWSRIKSGKPDFFNAVSKSKSPLANNSPDSQRNEADTCHRTKTDNFASFNIEPIDQGALNEHRDGSVASATTSSADNKENDDTIIWTDPCTKKTHLLNARTGCVMPDARARPDTDPTASIFGTHTRNKSVRLPSRPSTAVARKTPWLDNVLDTWENPVFKPTEKRIQQVNIHEDGLDPSHHPSRHGCSRFDIDRAFNQASTGGSSRLSKEGLKNAQVISQVDKKFILVKMQSFASEQEAKAGLLVLIDQHAADERVQVESLFRELCTPLPQARAYKSQLGHGVLVVSTMLEKPMQFAISSRERTHFTTHAARFAAWGILYDILVSAFSSSSLEKDKHVLSVTTLPPAISERCKADPKVLISFLRSTVWKYVEDAHLPPLPQHGYSANKDDWVRRLATCPPGLVDLVNSRACRSAIMFNDTLKIEECTELVRKLADCVFPFMCAHGRPSMVPLVDLGTSGDAGSVLSSSIKNVENKTTFVQAWRNWQK
ncbi:DNA mismatch repair protein [Pyrenophora tritici-repentis]|nr:DNA mismatch repair protein [Pyrenophora tritici-repentis]